MQPEIHSDSKTPPVDRGYAVSMVIKSFKGHADVEVYLFRPFWDEEEYGGYPWEELIGGAVSENRTEDPENGKKLILETFSADESERLIEYLRKRYWEKLSSIHCSVLDFPVPLDLTPLSSIQTTDTIGRMDLDKIPNYPLEFPVKGIYDLSRHERTSDRE